MKKLMIAAAMACAAALSHGAAAVGWSAGNIGSLDGNYYQIFITSPGNLSTMISSVTADLDKGTAVTSYADGAIGSTGISYSYKTSTYSLDKGDYSAFFVVFDSETPVAGQSKYAVISGAANLNKSVTESTPSVTFAAGNASSYITDGNWKSFGTSVDTPEPTSGLLLLLGVAGLALKRKRA